MGITDVEQEQVTDYPLISKAKGAAAFRNALHEFFVALVRTIAQTGLMYEENQLMENIQVWICTMSSATNRPFRHTSTLVALGITSGLSRIANDIAENTAKMMRQKETEAKKSRANKSRLATIDKEVEELNQKLEHVKALITDWFDTVYVHRYRDVDPKIRVECCEALAEWIMIYPDKFFDGQHLRYLGWILSDTNEGTRAEVLKQLAKLYSDNDKLAGLKTFTERFRTRIVEIATRDAHTNIRATAVELLDILREAGFLAPDDIDTVGKLIFDSEPKVRKAVVGFFAENVNMAYDLVIEDMGGQEALDEALAQPDDEEYENPRLEWLKMKCLVEQLRSYDEDTGLPSQIERVTPYGSELGLVAAGIESRFSLAAQALYDAVPEIRSWEVLAGYLLFDHSQTTDNAGDDAEAMLRQNCKLEEEEETALLDILNATVRIRLQRLAETQKDKKRTKSQRMSDQAEQEETAKKLTILIPQLLKKFGALPEAAALCLRLERELNLEVFQELRQNSALTALLDDINKQFLTHHSERVLGEAIGSILHALGNEELKELVESKTQALWDDLSGTFDALRRGRDLSARGGVEQNILSGISNIILKMSELAKASEPAVLDQIPAPTKSRTKNQKNTKLDTPPIASLLQILDRGVPADDLDNEVDEAEDALVRHTMSLMLPYFLWKCRKFSTHIEEGTRIPDNELTVVAERRDLCMIALMRVIESRKGADEIRVEAADLLLDLYNLFRALKAMKSRATKAGKKPNGRATDEDANDDWEALCQDIDSKTVATLLQILTALENNLAKRLRKRLEGPDVDDDPIDEDEEPESSDDEGDDEQLQNQKQIRALLAEERLCTYGARLVHGVQVGSLEAKDAKAVRSRLERNKAKLTHSWKEVVGHLDINKHVKGKSAKKAAPAKEPAKAPKSKAIVVEDESEEEVQDEIEDEDMEDADANAEAEAEPEEEQANGDADEESVLGD